MTIKLTANETKIITHFAEGGKSFTFWDNGFQVDGSGTWGAVFNDELSSLCGVTVQSARGILGSLIKKDILKSELVPDAYPNANGKGSKPGHWVELTELGVELILARKAELEELIAEYGEDVGDQDELAEALAAMETETAPDTAEDDLVDPLELPLEGEAEDVFEGLNLDEEVDEEVELPAPVPAASVNHKAPTAHSECTHEIAGSEGKKARARCRAARAKALKDA